MISAKDEGRHPAGAGELWNESYYFNFYDGQNRIGGFTRIGLQENLNKSNVWCLLIKGGQKSYQRFLLGLSYNKAGMDEGVTVGGLTYRMLEPLKKFKIEFKDRDTELDLLWEAVHPVIHIGEKGERLPENIASSHYEQGGLVTGTFMVRGEKFAFQGVGMRDHSWGIRDWEGVKNWMGIWPVFGKDSLCTCIRVTLLDGKVSSMGFIFDGQENLEITHSDLKVEFAEDGLTQKRVQLNIKDEKGKQIQLEGELIANFPLPYDCNIINEAMFEYRMGDRLGYGLFEYNVRP